MDTIYGSDLTVSRMDRKKAVKASEEISDLLKEAFEKHKTVCRGYQKLEEELRQVKESSAKDNRELNKLKRENSELADELSDAKVRISDLSKRVVRLQGEVEHWNRKACEVRQAKGVDQPLRTIQSPENDLVKPKSAEKHSRDLISRRSLTETTNDGEASSSRFVVEVSLDDEGEEILPDQGKISRHLFPGRSASNSESPNSLIHPSKRKQEEDFIPETPPPPPRTRPLQTNTCKVCERYWRAEDVRLPGQLKVNDLPYCKIHGKNRRPPSTPENFWKQARLSPPPKR